MAAPWEPPTSNETDGYDIGANQTDCDAFWAIERAAERPGATRSWFQPGANLDHTVHDTGDAIAIQIDAAFATLADLCPTVRWLEGGSFDIEVISTAAEGVQALELVNDTGEVEWVALAVRGNLVSRLRYVRFGDDASTQPDHEALEEFAELATAMLIRLAATDPQPVPDSGPMPSAPTLEAALVTAADLPGAYTETKTDTYESTDPDGEWIAGCDASRVVKVMDSWFTLERLLRPDDGGVGVQHLLGRAPNQNAARAAVAGIANMQDCDLSADVSLGGATLIGGVVPDGSGGLATYLQVSHPDEPDSGLLVAYHAHDVIGVLAMTSESP